MNPFTQKRMRASDDLKVTISRHFHYSEFGARGRYDTQARTGAYINSDTPGMGFFVHDMDSKSYRGFVKEQRKKLKHNVWQLLFHKEPSFPREIARVEKALEDKKMDNLHRHILGQYLNCLYLGKEEELYQRIVRGVKDKIGHNRRRNLNKHHTSVMTHYKSRIATLMHDVKSAQINIKDTLDEEALAAWNRVTDAFTEMVTVRRLWHVDQSNPRSTSYTQVFFDFGIFDYIQSPFDTPLLRDAEGGFYFLYPQGIIKPKSNVDFEFIPMSELDFAGGVADLNTLSTSSNFTTKHKKNKKHKHSDAVSNLYATTGRGMVVGQLSCKRLGLTFYCNHVTPVEHFVQALNEFKKHSIPLSFKSLGGGIRPR